MCDITFEYETTATGLRKTHIIKLCIPYFVKFLNENTYHDIRTRHRDSNDDETEVHDDSDLRIFLKINFQRNNNIIDIYFQSLDPVILKSNLTLRYLKNSNVPDFHSINKTEYHSIEAYKWQHIITLYKQDFVNTPAKYALPPYERSAMTMEFQFKVITGSDEQVVTLSNDFEYLLKNNLLSDVNIVSAEQIEYKAHKAILASRSAVFKAIFKHTTESSTNVVESPFESEVLKELLTFIYSDKSPRVNEIPEKLLAAADYYQLSRLKSLCEEGLCKKLSVNNAIEIIKLADLHSAEKLKQWTLEFIKDRAGLIVKTEGWAQINCVKLTKMIFEYMATNDFDDYNVNEIKYYELEPRKKMQSIFSSK